jgi:hypothetical protein
VSEHTPTVGLPKQFVAAWERTELVVDGDRVPGAGRAVWVEAGIAYVDVRGPGGFASATTFAGTTTWEEPYLAWAHAIDAEPGEDEGTDRGLITYDGDDLIESGEVIAGRTITYSERWHRLPGSPGVVLAASTDGGMAVRVGHHASVVVDRRATGGAIAARYSSWDGSAWVAQIEFGDPAAGARLPAPLEPDADLPDGWSWT